MHGACTLCDISGDHGFVEGRPVLSSRLSKPNRTEPSSVRCQVPCPCRRLHRGVLGSERLRSDGHRVKGSEDDPWSGASTIAFMEEAAALATRRRRMFADVSKTEAVRLS